MKSLPAPLTHLLDMQINFMNSFFKKILPLIISLVIMALLYSRLDFASLGNTLNEINIYHLCFALMLLIPISLVSALRFMIITSKFIHLKFSQSIIYILASNTLNFVIPSKMGSFSKAYFLQRIHGLDLKKSLAMVIYERMTDLFAMSLIYILFFFINFEAKPLLILVGSGCVVYIFMFILTHSFRLPSYPKESTFAKFINMLVDFLNMFNYYAHCCRKKKLLVGINIVSFFLWALHTFQLVMFFDVIGSQINLPGRVTYLLCSVFLGFLPITFAGVGIRDWAIIRLTENLIDYNKAILLGILTMLRNLIPCLAGWPFLYYLTHKILNPKKTSV